MEDSERQREREREIHSGPGVGNFDDGEGHYIFTVTPGGHNAYTVKNSRSTSLKLCLLIGRQFHTIRGPVA